MTKHTTQDVDRAASGVSRRAFLGAGMASSAALLGGGGVWQALADHRDDDDRWMEKSIPELQRLLHSGRLTSRELTQAYLRQIRRLNPQLNAVIETNPAALWIAWQLDAERRRGRLRGPLHGIPILIKDNIATRDNMETTAGSLALVGSRVPGDARVVSQLREAGAIILGKSNLGEWANFRGNVSTAGWSARGGFTRNPYLLSWEPCGSSSGSGVAPAANMCAAAVGTETDGSIVCPSGNNLIVGLKPSLGLLSQRGIIPIAASQDTAGPMCRTVTDAAIMLSVMQSPTREVARHHPPQDYRPFLRRNALRGKRIGVDRRYFTADYGGEPDLLEVVQRGLDAMENLGATLIETDTGDTFEWFDAEFAVLLFEFKVQIAEYLATLRRTSLRTLADLIAFNKAHCLEEMKYFGQEVFELAEATSGDLHDPDYVAARELCLKLTREEGIDAALKRDKLDAIVAPSFSFGSSVAAVAGYPNISVPVGLTPEGKPAGIWMYSGFLQEAKLLSFAYALEQELEPRRAPQLLGEVPELPPDGGFCNAAATSALQSESASSRAHLSHHFGTGKAFKR
ncbi:MAG TPA: amidase family protein [Blastocatellia bacterium]|nr:amidase family protein [Blastocatellia bacterium]